MTMPKSPGVIVDLMKSNTGQKISFKAREPFKYLQLEGSLWPCWLCSHVGMKKRPTYEGQKRMKSTKSNEEVEKGQEGRDKSQSWMRQTSGRKWILKQRAGLTVAGSCTVSVPAGSPRGLHAPLSGSEFQLLLNGARLGSPSHCSPARSHRQRCTKWFHITAAKTSTNPNADTSVWQKHEYKEINTCIDD